MEKLVDFSNLLQASLGHAVVPGLYRLLFPSFQLKSQFGSCLLPSIDRDCRYGKIEDHVEHPDCPELFTAWRVGLVPVQRD